MADYEELSILSLSGRGFVTRKTFHITTPAAGADFTFTSDGGDVLLPVALTAVYTASAAVATRQSRLEYSSSDGVIAEIAVSNTVVASQTVRYGFHRGGGGGTSGATSLANSYSLPDMVLMPGETIASVTTAIDAADTWTKIQLTCLRVYVMSPERRAQLEDEGFEYGFLRPFRLTQPTSDELLSS